jgi:hypothetical protein
MGVSAIFSCGDVHRFFMKNKRRQEFARDFLLSANEVVRVTLPRGRYSCSLCWLELFVLDHTGTRESFLFLA